MWSEVDEGLGVVDRRSLVVSVNGEPDCVLEDSLYRVSLWLL